MKPYKTYYRSRYQYPTRVVCNGTAGSLRIGSKDARADIEHQIGRKLVDDVIIDKRGGNWRFREMHPPKSDRP